MGALLEGHPVVALQRQGGLAPEGQAVALSGARLVGGPQGSGALVERHVAVCSGGVQTVTLEERQVRVRRGAQGGAGARQRQQVRSGD